MHHLSTILAAAALFQRLAFAQNSSEVSNACPSKGGAHIIVARGSLEPPPFGVLLPPVKDSILAQIPGSTADAVVGYPNTLADYMNSVTAGAIEGRKLVEDYVSRCPGLPLVYLGYSQGAQIAGDSLIGQQERGFADNSSINQPLPASILSQVAAVIMMGDPTFNTTESAFHVGNATKSGSFPRQNVANFDIAGLASRTQSYCDAGDLFCAGGDSIIIHASYVKPYGVVAADYVVKAVANWYRTNGGSSASASVSASALRPSASASASSLRTSSAASASLTTTTVSASSSATTTPATASSTGAASSHIKSNDFGMLYGVVLAVLLSFGSGLILL